MGVFSQTVPGNTLVTLNPPFPSARMAKLFYEFLTRYKEWKGAKLKELILIHICLFQGLLALIMPWLLPNGGVFFSFILLIPFYFSTRNYLKVNERVGHLYVNVHILHHHLIGKLEVGFCDHKELCHCAENFRFYVLKHYGISLDNNFLE